MRRLLIVILLSLSISVSAQGAPFAQGLINNAAPYLGQPIIYTLRIYTLGKTNDSQVIEPSFAGFGRASLILEANISSEVIGTTLYQVVEQPYVLYPLRAGTLTIDPFTIDLPETPFQNGMTIFTDPVEVEVQALPDNAPVSYKNAVGQFEIETSTSSNELRSGDTFTLAMTISGTGNLEQVISPNISLPEGWSLFDSNSTLEQDNVRFGRKVFDWIVIPIGEGGYEIPSIEFTFFNPQSRQYETRRTAPITITLLPGNASAPIIPTREAPSPIKTVPELKAVATGLAPYPPMWFWALWLIAPLIVFFIWIPTKLKVQSPRRRRRIQKGSRAIREFRQALKQAQTDEPKAAYLSVETAIYEYLSARFGENIRLDNIEDFILELPLPLQEQIIACIEESHEGQYAPVTQADVIALLKHCLQVFMAVEGELK